MKCAPEPNAASALKNYNDVQESDQIECYSESKLLDSLNQSDGSLRPVNSARSA